MKINNQMMLDLMQSRIVDGSPSYKRLMEALGAKTPLSDMRDTLAELKSTHIRREIDNVVTFVTLHCPLDDFKFLVEELGTVARQMVIEKALLGATDALEKIKYVVESGKCSADNLYGHVLEQDDLYREAFSSSGDYEAIIEYLKTRTETMEYQILAKVSIYGGGRGVSKIVGVDGISLSELFKSMGIPEEEIVVALAFEDEMAQSLRRDTVEQINRMLEKGLLEGSHASLRITPKGARRLRRFAVRDRVHVARIYLQLAKRIEAGEEDSDGDMPALLSFNASELLRIIATYSDSEYLTPKRRAWLMARAEKENNVATEAMRKEMDIEPQQ